MTPEQMERLAALPAQFEQMTDLLGGIADRLESLLIQQETRGHHPEFYEDIREQVDILRSNRDARGRRRAGIAYFVQNGNRAIKIGSTIDLKTRLSTLQNACSEKLVVLGVIDGGEETERRLHKKFAHLRLIGEWFTPSPELTDFIKESAVSWEAP